MKDWFNNRVPPRNRKPHHQFSLRRLAPRLTLATVVAVTMFAPQALAQQRSTALSDVRSLAPNEILRNLRSEPDKTHFYKLEVEAQKFVKIVVEQQGTDLSLTVETPQKTLYRQIGFMDLKQFPSSRARPEAMKLWFMPAVNPRRANTNCESRVHMKRPRQTGSDSLPNRSSPRRSF
jgi:hypothetical protein